MTEHDPNKFGKREIEEFIEMIKSFGIAGLELTMTAFNKEGKIPAKDTGKSDQVKN